jgi:hypothetical protein
MLNRVAAGTQFCYFTGTNYTNVQSLTLQAPQGIDLWGGSSWYVYHRNFMQFITECIAAHDGDFSAHQV